MESSYRLNRKVEIRQCGDGLKGLGLFAAHRLTKGLKIMSEEPLLVDETRDDLAAHISYQFPSLSEAEKSKLVLMYAGYREPIALLPAGAVKDAHAGRAQRLQMIARYNSFEGIGIGCALSPGSAAINHACSPNAFLYYNSSFNYVTLHAIRDIQAGEEVTISYFQESVYLTAAERNNRLADGSSGRASEAKRNSMKSLREQLTRHHEAELPGPEETREAISASRELIKTMEDEGLFGLEMALCLAEQGRMFTILGDNESAERLNRQSMIIRRLCIGFDHPSCMLSRLERVGMTAE
ncbi:SET domain-containing protein 5 [Apiospora rasikravindrae]|uniref:SET domain-containing protein 5 n=1 Tax=Apiospora rasikravindrae TaxID=990691 RepID=A0ABR1UBZ7_9PEZI